MSLRLRGLLTLLVLLVLSFIFAMFQGGFVSWFLFFSLFVLTVLTCLWSYNWFKGLQVERMVSTKQAGYIEQCQALDTLCLSLDGRTSRG
mgnify:CR=1 FL=1